MADQATRTQEGVSRRKFLKFAGIGFAAGFAAMLMGSRGRDAKKSTPVSSVPEDSMFRPKDTASPRS